MGQLMGIGLSPAAPGRAAENVVSKVSLATM